MSEKKNKRRKDEYTGPGGAEQDMEKPTKDEYKVAKWLRRNVATKKTKFLNHNVEYFSSGRALDALMESKFAKGTNPILPNRDFATDFLDNMLIHKFFHRARKVPVTEQELRGKSSSKSSKQQEKEKHEGTDAESQLEGTAKTTEQQKSGEKEKKKRKIRLDMHPEQLFVDGAEAYVWIYDPIPMHYWLFGALLVAGAILLCLFPLWPPSLRKGVYYLSIAAAGFLTFILGLAVLRLIVFCIVWVITASKYHFWLFPNLTEDVGFFASFRPIYTYKYLPNESSTKTDKKSSSKSKKSKKDKDSDAEDETTKKEKKVTVKQPETTSSPKRKQVQKPEDKQKTVPEEPNLIDLGEPELERKNSFNISESEESESSNRSSTGKDFEIVDSRDVDTS